MAPVVAFYAAHLAVAFHPALTLGAALGSRVAVFADHGRAGGRQHRWSGQSITAPFSFAYRINGFGESPPYTCVVYGGGFVGIDPEQEVSADEEDIVTAVADGVEVLGPAAVS
jgi:hypothetical protein